MNLPPRGELNGTNFIAILKDAAQTLLTGMIRLENGAVIKVVYLQKGVVSFASSNEKTDRLTEVLKRAGKLTPEQVEDAQARLKPNVSIGKTLVELGYIGARDLLWGARAQVDSILHQMLFWTQGKYQVQEGQLPKEIIHLNLAIPTIIFDGIMKTQNREWILQHIGSPDAIYELADDFHKKNETWKLPVSEIASHLNGKRSLHDIAEKSEVDTFEICKTVVALECLGLASTIQDSPLQMDLSAPEAEPSHETVISEGTENPLQEVQKEVESLEFFKTKAVEPAESEPAEPSDTQEEQPVPVVPMEPVIAETPLAQTEEAAEKQEVQEERESDSMEVEQSEEEASENSVTRWKTPLTMILLITAIALGIFYYLQHQPSPPTVQQAPVIKPSESPKPSAQPIARRALKRPETKPVVPLQVPGGSALGMLQDGKTQEAAQTWRKNLEKHNFGYTIQLVIACQDKTVQDTYRLLNFSKEIIVLPLNFKGQNCYRVLYGQFRAREYAQTAVRSLPDVFLKQPSPPTVIGFSKIL